MQSSSSDAAFTVCKFLNEYNAIWARYFPCCVKRAHWQIAQLVRTRNLLFSDVRSKIGHMFGMDAKTCADRTRDLIAEGLIETSDPELGSKALLKATPKLVDLFDRHTVDAIELLHASAKSLDSRMPKLLQLSPNQALNKRFLKFFEEFLLGWNDQRLQFLTDAAEKHPPLRNPVECAKANNALKTHAYWHIFITAWLWRHPSGGAKRSYLLVEDFQATIHTLFQYGSKATSGYVKSMEKWGLLERQGRNENVPRNKYAVRMTDAAFATFGNSFALGAPALISAARDFSRLSNGMETGQVVPFRSAG